jgi:hypothetical protein
MSIENEYYFDEKAHFVKKSSISSKIKNFIWNWQTKEFLGRDSASWGELEIKKNKTVYLLNFFKLIS